jgi:hypothetical protein
MHPVDHQSDDRGSENSSDQKLFDCHTPRVTAESYGSIAGMLNVYGATRLGLTTFKLQHSIVKPDIAFENGTPQP